LEKEKLENLSRWMESCNGGLTISSAVCSGSAAASGGICSGIWGDLQRHLIWGDLPHTLSTWHGQVGLRNISQRASEWEERVASLPWEDMRDVLEIMTQTDKDRGPTFDRLLTRPPSRQKLYSAPQGSAGRNSVQTCEAIRNREETHMKWKSTEGLYWVRPRKERVWIISV
jgi:hypothetical protein